VALALTGCGGAGNRAAEAADDEPAPAAAQQSADVDATPAGPATATTSPEAPAEPQVTTKTITETKPIPYATRTVQDGSLAKGVTKTRTKGVAGLRTLTYQVTYTDGEQTSKKLIKSVVTRAAVPKVVAVGTKTAPSDDCDPNYSGCVPIASDVDCAGGSGNGPAYASGPVRVIGTDIYDLDRDGDGVACD